MPRICRHSGHVHVTFGEAVQSYLTLATMHMSQSHAREVARILTKTFQPIHKEPLHAVTTKHITDIIDALVQKTPGQALHVHNRIKTFYKWCRMRNLIAVNPIEYLSPPGKYQERDRVLSDNELIAVYSAARAFGYPYGAIVRLAIHTGLRRANLAEMEWAWITPELITIPASSMKAGQAFLLPNCIQHILDEIPRKGRYVFPSDRGTPFSAFSKTKRKFDALTKIPDVTLHDCRRTMRTNLSRWRCCSSEIAELLISHNVKTKIRRVYDHYDFLDEKREALQRYSERLRQVIELPIA